MLPELLKSMVWLARASEFRMGHQIGAKVEKNLLAALASCAINSELDEELGNFDNLMGSDIEFRSAVSLRADLIISIVSASLSIEAFGIG